MWRSRTTSLLLRWSIRQKFKSLPSKPSSSSPSPSNRYTGTKFFSSAAKSSRKQKQTSTRTLEFGKNPDKNPDISLQNADRSPAEPGESDPFPFAFADGDEATLAGLNENEIEGGDDLTSFEEESINNALVDADENGEEVAVQIPEVNLDQLESVVSILQSTLPQEIESSLENLKELLLTEEFVVRVFRDAKVSGENLVSFFRWAIKKAPAVKTSRALHLLIETVSASDKIEKMEAYMLWDLTKEFVKMEGTVTTEMLNQIISIFWKLEKSKAGMEVFNKFDEFGCAPDGNTYYLTIEALGKKSMIDTAWSVCEKMLNSGRFPDVEKLGEIIVFFSRRKKVKGAHLVYQHAKKKDIFLRRNALHFLICGLCRKDKFVYLALEILEEDLQKSQKYDNKTFSSVVQSLTRIKDPKAAMSLLLRMAESGPRPQKSAFNYVITGLCKGGEVEDAIALTKIMESKGLNPDVYTYSVIMSCFAKAGMMDEAFQIYCQAKKKHKVLTPVTYHILIRGYCKMEQYEKALECLKEMKEHGVRPNSDEYDKLIKTLCLKAVDWRTAEKLSGEMKENGVRLNGSTQSLITALKMLEEEEIAADESKIES